MSQDEQPARWRIDFLSEDGIVQATATGRLDMVVVTQKAVQTLREGSAHTTDKYLIDDREAELDLETFEIYQLPRQLEEMGLRRNARVAVVYTLSSPTADDFRFFETVALNQGFHVQLFTRLDEARTWLLSDARE